MPDNPSVDDPNATMTIGLFEEVLAKVLARAIPEALAPLEERIGRLEDRMTKLEREVRESGRTTEDSLRTIRTTMADMRSGYDVLSAGIRSLHRHGSVAGE